jgi:hypothetical protein
MVRSAWLAPSPTTSWRQEVGKAEGVERGADWQDWGQRFRNWACVGRCPGCGSSSPCRASCRSGSTPRPARSG